MRKDINSLFPFLRVSVLCHFFFFVFLSLKVFFFPAQSLNYEPSIRVDTVALPDKNTSSPKNVEKPVEETIEKTDVKKSNKATNEINLKKISKKKNKKAQNSSLARLKALQKFKKEKNKENQALEKPIKDNALQKGHSLTGLEKLQYKSYLGDLDSHIKEHWSLPEWLSKAQLKARILLLVQKSGQIQSQTFIARSGNEIFDQQVMETLRKANPLPPPPSDLVDFFAQQGVEIYFPD